MTKRTGLQRTSVVVATAVCATITWVMVHVLGGVDLTVKSGPEINAVTVALTAAVAAGAGWLALVLVERRSAHPRRTWTVLAVAVFVVSLLGPLGSTTAATGSLLALHSVVAAVVIAGLGRTARADRSTTDRPVPATPSAS